MVIQGGSSVQSRVLLEPRVVSLASAAAISSAQAIAIASSPFIFANEEMAIPAILYSLMMNVVLLIYVGIVRKLNNK